MGRGASTGFRSLKERWVCRDLLSPGIYSFRYRYDDDWDVLTGDGFAHPSHAHGDLLRRLSDLHGLHTARQLLENQQRWSVKRYEVASNA